MPKGNTLQLQVIVPTLNVRDSPDIKADNFVGVLSEGTVFFAEEEVIGQEHKKCNRWYRDHHNRYYWGGGVQPLNGSVLIPARPEMDVQWPPILLNWNLTFAGADLYRASAGHGINVAMLDDGISEDHQDLLNRHEPLVDVTNQQIVDAHANEHGTAVAGIIGASASSDKGIIGVAPRCRLLPIRIYKRNDHRVDYLIDGIHEAIRGNAHIINISYSFPDTQAARDVIVEARSKGIVIVASAGDQRELNSITFPASHPEVISVGACTPNIISRFGSDFDERLDFVGAFIARWVCSTTHKKFYTREIGSSFCSAYVTGLLALILSHLQKTNKPVPQEKDKVVDLISQCCLGYDSIAFNSENQFAIDSFKRIKQTA